MRTLHEGARGCGFRKPGGLYLVTDGEGEPCNALPVELTVCPHCGQGIKPARGWTWVNPDSMLKPHPHRHAGCPLSKPGLMGERAGLLWIGESFYATPQEWLAEAQVMGVSRRISNVPKGFKVGTTWVVAAHRKCIHVGYVDTSTGTGYPTVEAAWANGVSADLLEHHHLPGAFHVFRPQRIEYVVHGTETDEELEALEARGIEPVVVVPLEQQLLA